MKLLNIEIKAQGVDAQRTREILLSAGARYAGRDHQVDTYYHTEHGRLKLRQGNIENALIAYHRENTASVKRSDVLLYRTQDPRGLKEILDRTCTILAVVDKMRDIYYIGNVKFHVDEVAGLGAFAEIEALETESIQGEAALSAQVHTYMEMLGIREDQLLAHSYSDMVMRQSQTVPAPENV